MNELLKLQSPKTKKELLARVKQVIEQGWSTMPSDVPRYNGSGGPGNYLEDLLGLKAGNQDVADCIGFEVKYHTKKTHLVTLFHKEPEPSGIMRYMVSTYGWKDKKGRLSFRHTINGESDRFTVNNDAGNIIIRPIKGSGPNPVWSHDTLLNVAGGKLRRLVAVEGERKGRVVRFNRADLYEDLRITRLIQDLVAGRIAIDFDVRENEAGSKALRNHGTKFRVSLSNLPKLYDKKTQVD